MERRRIDSGQNPTIKQLARLGERRERERAGRFLVEGRQEVERALSGGWDLLELYLAPELASREAAGMVTRSERAGVPVVELSAAAFGKLSHRQNPDGVLAVAAASDRRLDELELGTEPLLLVLDGVEKPGNLGALLRTADGSGADAVIMTGAGTDPFNPNVVRASMGSLFTVPWCRARPEELREFLAGNGIRTVATSPAAERVYWETGLRGGVALVLGTEHDGLGSEWLSWADELVRIPMRGGADSLNVATAGALFLYEAVRQRSGAGER